jgi:hypothetical protein
LSKMGFEFLASSHQFVKTEIWIFWVYGPPFVENGIWNFGFNQPPCVKNGIWISAYAEKARLNSQNALRVSAKASGQNHPVFSGSMPPHAGLGNDRL